MNRNDIGLAGGKGTQWLGTAQVASTWQMYCLGWPIAQLTVVVLLEFQVYGNKITYLEQQCLSLAG